MHLLRKHVAVGEDAEGNVGQLEPAPERAQTHFDGGAFAYSEAILAQHVLEPLRTARRAQEEDGGAFSAPQVGGEGAQIARVTAGGAAGEVEAACIEVHLPPIEAGALA